MKAKQTYDILLLLYVHIGSLPTPIIHVLSTTALSFTSPDGSRVERYIVEFECRVRNITFVEKYMSVSASGGTGQVATSVSCFGRLGQLYRVKVWAVSGPNISRQPAVKLVNTGTASTECSCLLCRCCNDCHTLISTVDRPTNQVLTPTPATGGSTGTINKVPTSTRSVTSSSGHEG